MAKSENLNLEKLDLYVFQQWQPWKLFCLKLEN